MAARIDGWMQEFLTGKCFDFALALAEKVPDAKFVAVGSVELPDHVGVRIGNRYADIRGVLDERDFLGPHEGSDILDIAREDVAFHCGLHGVPPPYRGCKDIAYARKAVRRAFPDGLLESYLEETAEDAPAHRP